MPTPNTPDRWSHHTDGRVVPCSWRATPHRLGCDYCRIERSDLPHRAARLQSVSLAYDDTLCACCQALEIPWSGRSPFAGVHRLEMEASLAQRGVTW